MLIFVDDHVFFIKLNFFSQRRRVQTMADNSVLRSTTGRTSLADSSIFDSKVTEISRENVLVGSASCVEGKPVNQLENTKSLLILRLTDEGLKI